MKRIVVLAALGVCCGLPASGASGGQPRVLRLDVAEWNIVPATGVVAAGRLRIDVRNIGEDVHQITLVRTSQFAPDLPLRGDHAAVRPSAVSALVEPGRTISLSVSVRRGSYVLLDNLPWHYWRGTSVPIAVR